MDRVAIINIQNDHSTLLINIYFKIYNFFQTPKGKIVTPH